MIIERFSMGAASPIALELAAHTTGKGGGVTKYKCKVYNYVNAYISDMTLYIISIIESKLTGQLHFHTRTHTYIIICSSTGGKPIKDDTCM